MRVKDIPNFQNYLNKNALQQYENKLHTTVFEYYERIVGSERSGGKGGVYQEGCIRKSGLIQYLCGIVSADNYDNIVNEQDIKDWAKILNYLADAGVWKYGTLLNVMSMTLAMDKFGNIVPMDFIRRINLEKTLVTQPAGHGRQIMLLTYIATDPKYGSTTAELNKATGLNVFVDEGALGTTDWRLK